MRDDDPRHGRLAGYKAGCRDTCCRDAAAEYQRGRARDQILKRPRTYPAHGFKRRLEALRALGWSIQTIADELGLDVRNMPATASRTFVHASTHHAMVDLYERLSMTIPDDTYANRRRSIARKHGFPPPLAWDDIDDPDATPRGSAPIRMDVDEVAVQRRMEGDRSVRLNTAEQVHLARRWINSGRVHNDCQRITGINLHRVLREVA